MTKIIDFVKALRTEHGTSSPFAICEALRIAVLYCELPQDINGFYLLMGESQVIFLSELLSEDDARVVCGHELGHALLHRDYNSVYLSTHTFLNCQRYEREADFFCACLLIENEDGDDGGVVTLEAMAQRAHVPLRLAELRYGS